MTPQEATKMFTEGLQNHLPTPSIPIVVPWLVDNHVALTIARKRQTKLGDYRPPFNGKGHRISVNGDLNPYAFLNTLVHEIAHLFTWKQFKQTVKPHGMEWKVTYQRLLQPFLDRQIFPNDLEVALRNYLTNPAASSCADPYLYKAFRKYDAPPAGLPEGIKVALVEELPEGQVFFMANGRSFIKGKKRRTRFLCTERGTNKQYTFSAVGEVYIVDKKKG